MRVLIGAALAVSLAPASAAHAEVARVAAAPAIHHVGPGRPLQRIRDAARVARDGDTVLIDPGDYVNDVASWPQSRLTLRAARCCARLLARRASAEGKAIWVIKGDDVLVENIEFRGARVPSRNGAGIRHEGGRLTIRNARFTGNEIGLLTWNQPRAELAIERSEFDGNRVAAPGAGGAPGHQIYVGRIGRFTLTESFVHHGYEGHLVKSRALASRILYNRISDAPDGRASYELEFPEGGDVVVLGNVVHQAASTENRVIIAYGAEGTRGANDRLVVAWNTIVDEWPGGGVYLRVWNKNAVVATANNLLLSFAPLGSVAFGFGDRDWHAAPADLPGAQAGDYRPRAAAAFVAALRREAGEGQGMLPDREYRHPRASTPWPGPRYTPGAQQTTLP